jgi:hypothetical protein
VSVELKTKNKSNVCGCNLHIFRVIFVYIATTIFKKSDVKEYMKRSQMFCPYLVIIIVETVKPLAKRAKIL